MLWSCPACHGSLEQADETVACVGCGNDYPVTAGVPDLRLRTSTWIDFDEDRSRALVVEGIAEAEGLDAALYHVFRNSRGFEPKKASYRVKQVYAGVEKCMQQIDEWLSPLIERNPVLELGCGPGQLLAAASSRGRPVSGLDVSLEWLVVAKYLVAAHGGEAVLAAGVAEHLPLRDATLGSVISLDVIEHVGNQRRFASEVARVLSAGGRFAISTPNRYSLSREPHVGVWGVGWLPVRLQARWVKLWSGQAYPFTRLLSAREIKRLLRDTGSLDPTVEFPKIPEPEIAIFTPGKARLARAYNRIIGKTPVQALAPFFGAYYRATGTAHPRAG